MSMRFIPVGEGRRPIKRRRCSIALLATIFLFGLLVGVALTSSLDDSLREWVYAANCRHPEP